MRRSTLKLSLPRQSLDSVGHLSEWNDHKCTGRTATNLSFCTQNTIKGESCTAITTTLKPNLSTDKENDYLWDILQVPPHSVVSYWAGPYLGLDVVVVD